MKKFNLKIFSSIFFLILLTFFFLSSQNNKDKKGNLESFGISKSNLISKFENENSLDVFVSDNSTLQFYIFGVAKKDNDTIYDKRIFISAKYLLDYSARKKVESEESVKFIKDDIEATNAVYREDSINLNRTPYYGVSISPQIKNLKVNGEFVNQVIEYPYKGDIFYIWYFNNLNLDTKNIDITW